MMLNAMLCLLFCVFYELEEFIAVFESLYCQEGILN